MIPITFVDLETTGLDPDIHEIIEFGAIQTQVENKNIFITDTLTLKVMPSFPVEPYVAKINGYNDEEWSENSVTLEEALGKTFNLMQDSWHAGSNPKFDEAFLKNAADNWGWSYPKLASYHLIDVTTLAFPLLLNGCVEKLKQETIANHYKIDGGGHRAFADAKQCLDIFAKINNLSISWKTYR